MTDHERPPCLGFEASLRFHLGVVVVFGMADWGEQMSGKGIGRRGRKSEAVP